jgi:hypothetical protein
MDFIATICLSEQKVMKWHGIMMILVTGYVGLGNEIACYSLVFLVCDRNPTYRVHAPYT